MNRYRGDLASQERAQGGELGAHDIGWSGESDHPHLET